MKINANKENLEKALSSLKEAKKEKSKVSEDSSEKPSGFANKEEEIGFHKGALNTLVAERNELVKIIVNVESIMQAHLKRLEELGVKIQKQEEKK